MATDYDAPRRGEVDEMGEDSLEELKARRAEAQSGSIDVDETELNESLGHPRSLVEKGACRHEGLQRHLDDVCVAGELGAEAGVGVAHRVVAEELQLRQRW